MSQHDFVIDNQSFPATRTDLNAAILAVASNSSGATAPTTTYANQFWYDTSTDILKVRNEANSAWINLFTIGSQNLEDLYLSGGVYLGGTGAANKLDDYEEGTWTPVFSDASSGGNPATANGGKRGFYTKIGNTVHVYCIGSNLVTTGMTGANDLYIQGLPFTPTSFNQPNQSFVGTARLGDITFTGYVVSQVNDNTTYLRLNEVSSNAGTDSIIVSQLTSAAADVILSMTYITNS